MILISIIQEVLPLLDEETKEKPENLARDYGDLCLVADGFAQVYPEHKYLIVECLRDMGYVSFFDERAELGKMHGYHISPTSRFACRLSG
jgi:hypothetical protein